MASETSPPKPRSANRLAPWMVQRGDPDFPARLRQPEESIWTTLHGIGNRVILGHPTLALVCSIQCPGSVVIKTFDAVRELRDAGVVVAGGFHSPMEKDCLDFLLRGDQPVILCPARRLYRFRIPPAAHPALDGGRLLILSPFGDEARTATKARAQTRNEFVIAMSQAVLIPHAAPGGKAEASALAALDHGQTLFTLTDDANENLLRMGARPYDVNYILQMMSI